MPKRDPREILGREKLDDLWSEGFTVTKAFPGPDPYEIDQKIVPRDRSYQWVSRAHDLTFYLSTGWNAVPSTRHPGVFAPWGYDGECALGDLILVEKSKSEVEASHAKNHAKAHQNVADWYERVGAGGFTGSVTVAHEDLGGRQELTRTEINPEGATHTELPPELLPHLKYILKERDRLVAEEHHVYLKTQQQIAEGEIAGSEDDAQPFDLLACRVRCMAQAIENIRAKLKAEPEQEQQS